MIAVEKLTKTYKQHTAVCNVSFSVAEGTTLVLLGTSGSGKTTTLRIINRLVAPTSGNVIINGSNALALPPEVLRRNIGYVLQGYGLFPHYTVAQNIAVVPSLLKWDKEKINRRVDELLEKLDLPPGQYRYKYPAQLSGGQMQRVGLARALAANPDILLMDEPFGALDPLTRASVRSEFKKLDELKKKTIILVTHDVQEAFELGNTIGLMDSGIMQQLGTPHQLLFAPANPFVSQFLQHQRLQLELQAITLDAVWDLLPITPGAPVPAALHHRHTLWDALEKMTSVSGAIAVHHPEKSEQKWVHFAHLMAAVQHQKQNGKHNG